MLSRRKLTNPEHKMPVVPMPKRHRPELVPQHPMRFVTRRTGLTPARLRIWERRYGVVRPGRTDGGQRLYSDDDVTRLTLLARATAAGHALPQLARLSQAQLEALLQRDDTPPPALAPGGVADPALIERLLGYVERLDGTGLERALRRAALSHGTGALAEHVASPLLRAIGEGWHAGTLSPAHEHLASAVVRRVLTWVAGQFHVPDTAPVLVVATPAGERHELGAALAAAVAAEAGWRVVYLGADLPASDIAAAALQARARGVALSVMNGGNAQALGGEIARLAERLGGKVPLVVGGGATGALAAAIARAGARACPSLSHLRDFLQETVRT